jgi:hypothetical protein
MTECAGQGRGHEPRRPAGKLKYTPDVNQWGTSPWGDNDGEPGASRWTESPFDAPEVRPEAPPVFAASPSFPTYPQTQGWGQPGFGYPPQYAQQPPASPRRRGKVIGIVVSAVVVVLAVVIGSVVVWKFGSGGSGSEANTDTAAGKAEVASAEARPPAEVKVPSLSAAPTRVRWSYPPGGGSGGYPDVVGGDSKTVLVKLRDSLIGLNAATGSQLWQQPWSNGAYPDCVVGASGATAICRADEDALIVDMATGATKSTVSGQGNTAVYSGSGFLAFAEFGNGITVFDDSGQQLWKKQLSGDLSVFLDQRVIAVKRSTGAKFYDAKTGDELFSIGLVDDVIVTSRGVAVGVRGNPFDSERGQYPKQRIDFYSFTGKKAWSIPEEQQYRLPDLDFAVLLLPGVARYSTSGVALPILYSENKGEIVGVDDTTGNILWSQQVPISPRPAVILSGIGDLCILSLHNIDQGRSAGGVRARKCTDGNGALVSDTHADSPGELVAADGNQMIFDAAGSAAAYDAVTGRQVWQSSGLGRITWVGDALYGASLGAVSRLS